MDIGLSEGMGEQIFGAYINRTDKVVIVHRADFTVVKINNHGLEKLLIEGEGEGLNWLDEWVVTEERERVRRELKTLHQSGFQGPFKNEFSLIEADSRRRVYAWQHFGVRGEAEKIKLYLSVGEDVTEQREMAETLNRRNQILQALSLAAELFLQATPDVWERNVIQVLEQLGKVRGSNRVYVCKNRPTEVGEVGVSLKYEWKEGGEAHVFEAGEVPTYDYEAVGLARWAKGLSARQPICERVVDLPESERQWNVAVEAKSLVVVPVFVGNDWWGYLAFEDWRSERECSPAEIEALGAVAITFGAAIRRKRIEEALEAEKQGVEAKVAERTRELLIAQDKVEEALTWQKEEKARLTASIHSLSMGFSVFDLNGSLRLFNHAISGILGWPEGEATDKPVAWTAEKLAGVLRETVDLMTEVNRCVREGQEIKLRDLAYQDKFVDIYLTPVKMVEDDWRVIGAVVLIDDVTERKKLELSRDEFFAVAAHELRTPLTAIMGNATIIQDYFAGKFDAPEVNEMVADIINSSRRLMDIVNEYLDVSRLELNKIEMAMEKFDLIPEIREVMEELAATVKSKGLGWEVQWPKEAELWVMADKKRASQVLVNLLGNAIKYTNNGSIVVSAVDEAGVIKVRVVDTGEGVKTEDREMLFQKFKRVGDRVYIKDVKEGTGMGLYITRLLMEAMGGRVYLESSEPGKGSTFVVEFEKA